MPYSTVVAGTTITAAWSNTNNRDQVVTPFASTAARGAAITSPVVGMTSYINSNDVAEGLWTYTSAAQWRQPWNLPWGTLDYHSVTANQTGITTAVDLSGLATSALTLVGNRRIRITFECHLVETSYVAGDNLGVLIQEGASVLYQVNAQAYATSITTTGSVIITPTAGSHTYKLVAQRNGGTGTIAMYASSTYPAWILTEDIGPAGAPA